MNWKRQLGRSRLLIFISLGWCVGAKNGLLVNNDFVNSSHCAVKLALILCDERTKSPMNNFERQVNHTLVLLKSVLITMDEKSCIHVLLVSNKKAHFDKIKTEIFENPNTWDVKFTNILKLEYVPLKYPKGKEWMRGLYRNRPCSSFRLFLPGVLSLDSVILSDTDIIYLRNIEDLWSEGRKFSPSALVGMVPFLFNWHVQHHGVPHHKNLGFTSGVMLMNLTRMRKAEWTKEVLDISASYMPTLKSKAAPDESMMNAYFHKYPEKVHELACDWNFDRAKCTQVHKCMETGVGDGLSTLHGVSCAFCEKSPETRYSAVYQTFLNTQLKPNFDLRHLIKELKVAIYSQNPQNRNNVFCDKVPNFSDLVVGRLEEKLIY